MRTHSASALVALLVWALPSGALAQNTMADALDFYHQAKYLQAIDHLDRLAQVAGTAEVHQYRALCLLALGQADAARRAMAATVTADPFFTPSDAVASPKVVEMFAAVRRELLPPAIRRVFADATASFKSGARDRAHAQFTDVVRLLGDPALQASAGLENIAVVSSAFLELARAQDPPPPPPPLVAVDTSRRHALLAVAEPAWSPATPSDDHAAPPAAPEGTGAFVPPTPIDQTMPKWTPPNEHAAGQAFQGAIHVTIDEGGRVVSAKRQRTSHPSYDAQLLQAARRWRYKPALRHGRPVVSELVVEVLLRPSSI